MGIKQSKRSVEISSTPKKGAVDVPVQVDIYNVLHIRNFYYFLG